MNRIACCLGLVLFAVGVSGEVSLGIHLSNSLSTVNTDNTATRATGNSGQFGIAAGPALIFTVGDRFEIDPWVIAGFSQGWSTGNTTTTSGTLEEGCGFFFRLLKTDRFRFSLGPSIWNNTVFENEMNTIGISCPVNYDFLLTSRWSMRMTANLFSLQYHHVRVGDVVTNTFDYALVTDLSGIGLSFFLVL